jgi:hypothetical protein
MRLDRFDCELLIGQLWSDTLEECNENVFLIDFDKVSGFEFSRGHH